MPVVDFLRHGETVTPGALLGRTDAPLSPAGWKQIERQTTGRDWGAVVSSPLMRARAAAAVVARSRGLVLEVDPRWSEIDFGDWDGKERAALGGDAATAALLAAFYRDPTTLAAPNGERYQQVADRVGAALEALATREETILVIAHGGTIRTALSLALDMPLAKLWGLRIDCGTRVRLTLGQSPQHGLWGEITEIAQP
ncbi:MAG: histidine phosphatase family protein [Hyphomicrobium sp.]|jgi:alpha-ribazole phosphatase